MQIVPEQIIAAMAVLTAIGAIAVWCATVKAQIGRVEASQEQQERDNVSAHEVIRDDIRELRREVRRSLYPGES